MTFFKKKAISNDLTKLIDKDPNITLEDILLHKDLSPTIRNEAAVLYEKLLLNRENEYCWFDGIIQYALFGKTAPDGYNENNNINQINKNAAGFLENCGRKFISYFTEESNPEGFKTPKDLMENLQGYIEAFTSDRQKSKNTNRMYAGHFQRFIENFLRLEALNLDETIRKLTPFLIKNCRILAYQQMITRIICDYNETADEALIVNLLVQMLQRSCEAVHFVHIHKKKLDPSSSATKISEQFNKSQKIKPRNQPLNLNKEPIPPVDVVFNKSEDIQDLNEDKKNTKHIPKLNEKAKFDTVEDAEFEAYLLIMSIRASISEQTSIIDRFRDEDSQNNYRLIQFLLYCGTRSEVKSLVSLEAFRLLSIIFNGSISLDIEKWKWSEKEKCEIGFYKNYADEMVFDPELLTYKMIHALPVFWNHRYNKDSYELSAEEKEKIDTSDYFEKTKKDKDKDDKTEHFRVREKGETALEILQPCLLCDPPISSQLINTCTDIFIQLSNERRKLLKSGNIDDEIINSMIQLDGIVLDFYQHHFYFGEKHQNTTLSDLVQSLDVIPLPPTHDQYQVEKHKRRCSLSGFIVDFFLRMKSMDTNPFFQTKIIPLTNMGHQNCFIANDIRDFLDYQFLTNFELLNKNTIYNKQIHNEFVFESDEDGNNDDDLHNLKPTEVKYKLDYSNPTLVSVDEFSKSHGKIPKYKLVENDDDEDDVGNVHKKSKSKKVSQSTRPKSKKYKS